MQNFHPLLIHFPIALFITAVVFELVSFARKNDLFENIAAKLFILSAVAFIAAAITGLFAESSVAHNEEAHRIMSDHKLYQLIATGISVAIAALIFFFRKNTRIIRLLLAIFCVGFMTYGSYLGGELVYRFGVGTSLHVTKHHEDNQNEKNVQDVSKDSSHTEKSEEEHEHNHQH